MRLAMLALASLAALPAAAGDYFLLVQRDPRACRDRYASVRASPREVVADLGVAFQGGEPRLPALRAIATNAALDFCTPADRRAFEKGLVALGTRPRLAQERNYRELVAMLATGPLVAQLEAQLRREDLAPAARRRLEILRKEAAGRVALRRAKRVEADRSAGKLSR